MFASAQQSGFISIFYSVGSNPLALWDKQVKNGHIRRVIDDEVKSLVLDIGGTNVATTYITCPIKPRASLGVRLPYLVMVIKNMKKYFSFEIQILDDKDMRRRFRVSNFQSTTKVRPFCTTMPIGLSSGWNQVQFNLADFTKRAYGSMYLETTRVQIHANVRIRRIYFTDQLHSDEDLPNEFKLFAPGPKDAKKGKGKDKKPSKEALVPPIQTHPKGEEEVPPPPSPAEESPVPKEEPPASEAEPVEKVEAQASQPEEQAEQPPEEAPKPEEAEEPKPETAEEAPTEEAPPEQPESGAEEQQEAPAEGEVKDEQPIEASEAPQAESELEQPAESEGGEAGEPETEAKAEDAPAEAGDAQLEPAEQTETDEAPSEVTETTEATTPQTEPETTEHEEEA